MLKFLPARAYENGVYVIGVNQACKVPPGDETHCFPGTALIFSPNGQLIAETKGKLSSEKIVVTSLDPQKLENSRKSEHYFLRFRRPLIYKEILA